MLSFLKICLSFVLIGLFPLFYVADHLFFFCISQSVFFASTLIFILAIELFNFD